MIGMILTAVALSLLAGFLIKGFLAFWKIHVTDSSFGYGYSSTIHDLRITWKEYLIGAVIISIIVAPVVGLIGWNLAKADKLSYNEYWNGYELSANWNIRTCYEDGSCLSYSCHPYIYTWTTTDDKGNVTVHSETRYHQCPYVTQEWVFDVNTTLGDYLIAAANMPDDPQSFRWDASVGVPDNFPVGIPPFWQAAKNRIDAGKPGPVTKRMQYDNYILASDSSILKAYSDKIANFEGKGLLPKLNHIVKDFYHSDKLYTVGLTLDKGWYADVEYLNAALGTELQGDLHLVIVKDAQIDSDRDGYITALKAYWSNSLEFGDDALSKNTIIVVLGTDGTNITWARAITGMPLGNEYLIQQIAAKLPNTPLNAANVVGHVDGSFYQKGDKIKVQPKVTDGALAKILWGVDDTATKFKRVSMTDNSSDDSGSGFLYLSEEIKPSDGATAAILIITFILALFVWIGFAVYTPEGE